MQTNYFLIPEEILTANSPLKNPRYIKSHRNKEPEFLPITSTYKIVLVTILRLLIPTKGKNINGKALTYKDIHDLSSIPINTLKKIMPIIILNFSQYFETSKKKFGKGYIYKLKTEFYKKYLSAWKFYHSKS